MSLSPFNGCSFLSRWLSFFFPCPFPTSHPKNCTWKFLFSSVCSPSALPCWHYFTFLSRNVPFISQFRGKQGILPESLPINLWCIWVSVTSPDLEISIPWSPLRNSSHRRRFLVVYDIVLWNIMFLCWITDLRGVDYFSRYSQRVKKSKASVFIMFLLPNELAV